MNNEIKIKRRTNEEVMGCVTKVLVENQELKSKIALLESELFVKEGNAIHAQNILDSMLPVLREITNLAGVVGCKIGIVPL